MSRTTVSPVVTSESAVFLLNLPTSNTSLSVQTTAADVIVVVIRESCRRQKNDDFRLTAARRRKAVACVDVMLLFVQSLLLFPVAHAQRGGNGGVGGGERLNDGASRSATLLYKYLPRGMTGRVRCPAEDDPPYRLTIWSKDGRIVPPAADERDSATKRTGVQGIGGRKLSTTTTTAAPLTRVTVDRTRDRSDESLL